MQLSADIRRRILDQRLSMNAQNVKIVTQNGRVTLRGPGDSQDEKDAIGRIANNLAGGAQNVNNELEVLPNG